MTSILKERPQFRLYEPADKDQVLELHKRQGLKVTLRLPEEDPATGIGIVGELEGKIVIALFLRDTYELHLVGDPESMTPYLIRRAGDLAEGRAMQNGVERAKLRFPVPNDAIAFVPKSMTRMVEFLKEHMGFIDEATDDFTLLVKRIGS